MFKLKQLAGAVGGRVIGDADTTITGVQPFETAGSGDITAAFSEACLKQLDSTNASAVIVRKGIRSNRKVLLSVENPKLAFAQVLRMITEQPFQAVGVSPQASIGKDCNLSDLVSIHPFVSVGDHVTIEDHVTVEAGTVIGSGCRIGQGSTLHANVTLYPNVSLGARVVLHSGTVIGADGFGYVFDGNRQVKVPQTGRVEIHDDVEIGANSCVDRATFGATVIERGVKLDNHVHIAHNCRIGSETVIAGCVGISGSVTIGSNCLFAGQSGTVDHVSIGDNVTVMARAVVTKDVPSGTVISGRYGREHREELKLEALLRKLPQIYRSWRESMKG